MKYLVIFRGQFTLLHRTLRCQKFKFGFYFPESIIRILFVENSYFPFNLVWTLNISSHIVHIYLSYRRENLYVSSFFSCSHVVCLFEIIDVWHIVCVLHCSFLVMDKMYECVFGFGPGGIETVAVHHNLVLFLWHVLSVYEVKLLSSAARQ